MNIVHYLSFFELGWKDDVVTYLLTKADSRACVKWEEDEGIWREVFLNTVVEESVWVELQCYVHIMSVAFVGDGIHETNHLDPRGPFCGA